MARTIRHGGNPPHPVHEACQRGLALLLGVCVGVGVASELLSFVVWIPGAREVPPEGQGWMEWMESNDCLDFTKDMIMNESLGRLFAHYLLHVPCILGAFAVEAMGYVHDAMLLPQDGGARTRDC
jgi:hypothetical protein